MNFKGTVAGMFCVVAASAAPVMWEENGHYYELVELNLTWAEAQREALYKTHTASGYVGHLATVSSAAENAFLAATFGMAGSGRFAWLAGHEAGDDGIWRWEAGPDAGRQFSNFGTPTAPAFYANWGGIEPNDHQATEDYLMINLGNSFAGIARGQWADAILTPNPADPVLGYIVEYEPALAPDMTIQLDGNEVVIRFFGEKAREYLLLTTTTLPKPFNEWTPNASVEGAGTFATVRFPVAGDNLFISMVTMAPRPQINREPEHTNWEP